MPDAMADKDFGTITIVGVGLLGGSLGLAVKAVDPATRIVGVGHRQSSLDAALETGAVDTVTLDPAEGVSEASLVVLCTPVGLFEGLLKTIAPALPARAIVTDVGSTKAAVVAGAERILPDAGRFVGCHPIAGSEQRGVTFARADLYEGKTCVLTPTARTAAGTVQRVRRFWRKLGMRTVELTPARHDGVLARVSHLPHALAALLVNLQNDEGLDLAGTGFMDVTRIAGGDPVMWRDIFLSNRRAVREAIEALGRQLDGLLNLLAEADGEGLAKLFARAQQRRADMIEKRLGQKWVDA